MTAYVCHLFNTNEKEIPLLGRSNLGTPTLTGFSIRMTKHHCLLLHHPWKSNWQITHHYYLYHSAVECSILVSQKVLNNFYDSRSSCMIYINVFLVIIAVHQVQKIKRDNDSNRLWFIMISHNFTYLLVFSTNTWVILELRKYKSLFLFLHHSLVLTISELVLQSVHLPRETSKTKSLSQSP